MQRADQPFSSNCPFVRSWTQKTGGKTDETRGFSSLQGTINQTSMSTKGSPNSHASSGSAISFCHALYAGKTRSEQPRWALPDAPKPLLPNEERNRRPPLQENSMTTSIKKLDRSKGGFKGVTSVSRSKDKPSVFLILGWRGAGFRMSRPAVFAPSERRRAER